MNVPLIVTSAIVGLTLIIGLLSRRRGRVDIESWGIADRMFGGLLLWVLAAGEMFTTATFLGAAGYSYANGGRPSISSCTRSWPLPSPSSSFPGCGGTARRSPW